MSQDENNQDEIGIDKEYSEEENSNDDADEELY